MSEGKHTAGPWRVGKRETKTGQILIWSESSKNFSEMGRALAFVSAPLFPEKRGESQAAYDARYQAQAVANARLIAAAPDMLMALKGVVAVADRRTVEFDAARAAIAKAEGRS